MQAAGDLPTTSKQGVFQDIRGGEAEVSSTQADAPATTPGSASSTPPVSTTIAATTVSVTQASVCHHFECTMAPSTSQKYAGSPDAGAGGHASLVLCSNGTMLLKTALFYGASSKLIATALRVASGSARGRATDDVAVGPPIVNFCGTNAEKFRLGGTNYSQPCSHWDKRRASMNRDVPGVFVEGSSVNMSLARRLEDIAARPQRYYFEVYSLASWLHHEEGICRGSLVLAGGMQ